MGETPDQVRSAIDRARDRLGQDLNLLRYRVKQEIDWRYQFRRNPWAFVGGAFVLSLLAGMLSGRMPGARGERRC
jgi:ElaB/YqjD/DUF883 family membrane-anchored ribosome-binding protein